MERRGADEVVAIDVLDVARLDWPQPPPRLSAEILEGMDARNDAFLVAREALGSRVERRDLSVYDLRAHDVGVFDLAFTGTLLHHLRDPVGALMAIRSVLRGHLLCHEVITPRVSLFRPRVAGARFMAEGRPFWWVPNKEGLQRMIRAAGFRILRSGGPHLLRYGAGRSAPRLIDPARGLQGIADRWAIRAGVPHVWVLASPDGRADQPMEGRGTS